MSQILDLCITLAHAPTGSPSDALAVLELRCDALGLIHSGGLLKDPLTQKERESLRWYLEEYWKWPYLEFAERGKQVEKLLTDLGKRLYKAVFGNAMGIAQAWRLQPNAQRQISIVSEVPAALSLPWELLHDEQGFLVLRTRHPVTLVRRLPQHELSEFQTPFQPPLRILLVTARPKGTGFVDPRSIARELIDEVQEQVETGAIALEFLRPPTLRALRTRLGDPKRPPIHVLHFDGHGTFESETLSQDVLRLSGGGQGMLAFETDDGMLHLVEAGEVAQVLQHSGVRLAILTACQSATSATDDVFSSVSAQLIQGGVDAVIAMSASILVVSAVRYVEAFYRALAAGIPVPIAHEQARQALHDDPHRHLLRRRRDEEGRPVKLHDWWLPHFYQQRSLTLKLSKPRRLHKQHAHTSVPRLSTEMPSEPRYGFSGRAQELLDIECSLRQGKLVLVHGFGGIGKTALVRETADWLTRTKMYDGACFVSFEHGGDTTAILSTLGNYLGIYDGHYNPNDKVAALVQLEPVLKIQRTLVIADNLESVLPNGEAPLEATIRTQLWDVLLELTQMGAGVLLTSRDRAVGDGRLAPGKQVAHLALNDLHPEDAYVLASNLLDDLEIDRAHIPYSELRDLLIQLDHHPLAIHLVLPALRELPISKIRNEFSALLPKFVDDTATGRNRSLLASLDYSLRRLSEDQRALLSRLVIFEGGASEAALLVITEIPETEWIKLRSALEQAALLRAEYFHKQFNSPFLYFHPVLIPFLRDQYGVNDAAIRERYAQCYYVLARELDLLDKRDPQPARQLARRELPNLLRALDLQLEIGAIDAASDMAYDVGGFLILFGLERECEELRKRVAEAVVVQTNRLGGKLTRAEWMSEISLGERELHNGNARAAYDRFTALLTRIEALPEDQSFGRGSFEHGLTLTWLSHSLKAIGRYPDAEAPIREAIAINEALLKLYPDNHIFIRRRGTLLVDLADSLLPEQMPVAYREGLKTAEQQGDLRAQAVAQGNLGQLAELQQNYIEAKLHYTLALKLFHLLGEQSQEISKWLSLGRIAFAQKELDEAERYYREGLALSEWHGDTMSAAIACEQLAFVAKDAGHFTEARSWFKRALSIRKALSDASNDWKSLNICAEIAKLEGQEEIARDFRSRMRKAYAASTKNRSFVDGQCGPLIETIAIAAKGNLQMRMRVDEALPQLESMGWRITASVQRIWTGGRDWHLLVDDVENMDLSSALLILRVLETIAETTERQNRTVEQILGSLPFAIQDALRHGDVSGYKQALQTLSFEERQVVLRALLFLQNQQEGEAETNPWSLFGNTF